MRRRRRKQVRKLRPARKLPQRAMKAESTAPPAGDDASADAVDTTTLRLARLAERATSAATATQELIVKESSWARAANDANTGSLQRAHAKLQDWLTARGRELLDTTTARRCD